MKTKTNDLQNTVWDNTSIYQNLNDPAIQEDMQSIEKTIADIALRAEDFSKLTNTIANTQLSLSELATPLEEAMLLDRDTGVLLRTINVYASTYSVVDSQNTQAKELASKCSMFASQLDQAFKPILMFLYRMPENLLNELLEKESLREFQFTLQHNRKNTDYLLSVNEEKLISSLSTDGLHAWGKLYTEIAGNLKVNVNSKEMGIAAASGLLRSSHDRKEREDTYRGIEAAWENKKESAAAILSSINGWRLELNRNRSHTKEQHYLDVSCHQSRISKKTLNTLLDTTWNRREVGLKATKLMAKANNLNQLGPWDILQPSPISATQELTSFPDAIELISKAFSEFDPKMGEFAIMMHEKNWIDGQPTENRAPGAFCTKFSKQREPRVFMTYTGSMGDVITLAHEIGHAYHNWVLKDVPIMESMYSMTLAETASIFAETLVRDYILSNSKSTEEKLSILWQELESASAFLINIPSRFEIEKNMVELRKQKALNANDLCKISKAAQEKWYGDTLSEYSEYHWASKLHYSISGLSFYNYPYLFGYLFSLGIYAQKDKNPEQFVGLYEEILKNTGTMTAEDLIKKNLNMDIESADFWNNSINIVERSIDQFSTLLKQ